MPVYSISRTSQYTTVTALETKTNQDGFSWNGFDLDGYHSFFVVTRTTVCPIANQTWDYSVPSAPTSNYVWYPYSITLTVSGGNPNGNGQRPGIAYLKLYTSAGTYLMGSYTTNSLASAGATAIFVTTGPSVQATTFVIINSRNTITLTAASTTFGAGFAAPTTATAFWNIFSRTTGQTGQNVYNSAFTSTANAGTGNISGATITHATQSMMGFITYNAGPVKPVSFTVTPTTNGISITCQGNESQSISTGSVGAVSQIIFFYSLTLTGTYNVLGTDASITRTLISGTTYQYTASISGTLDLGQSYYFKVATRNDVSIQYQIDVPGSVAASEQSDAVNSVYGSVIHTRNVSNVWDTTTVRVRGVGVWNNATIKKRNDTNTAWLLGY
jgi:hypothetical protein